MKEGSTSRNGILLDEWDIPLIKYTATLHFHLEQGITLSSYSFTSTRRNPSAFEQVALLTRHRTIAYKTVETSTGTEINRTHSGRNF
jgi:hypothetical protein